MDEALEILMAKTLQYKFLLFNIHAQYPAGISRTSTIEREVFFQWEWNLKNLFGSVTIPYDDVLKISIDRNWT